MRVQTDFRFRLIFINLSISILIDTVLSRCSGLQNSIQSSVCFVQRRRRATSECHLRGLSDRNFVCLWVCVILLMLLMLSGYLILFPSLQLMSPSWSMASNASLSLQVSWTHLGGLEHWSVQSHPQPKQCCLSVVIYPDLENISQGSKASSAHH